MKLTSNILKPIYSVALAAGLFLAVATPADAADYYAAAPRADVLMCVAMVTEQADYNSASRVRHEVVSTKRRSVGYRLDIETTVYAATNGDVIREYISTCHATGGSTPSKFEIMEKSV